MKRLKHEHGFALVGVLLVIVLVTTIGLALMPLANNSLKSSQMNEEHQSAFYIAEAGMNMKMAEIEEQIYGVYEDTSSELDFYNKLASELVITDYRYDEFEKVKNVKPFALIDVKKVEGTKNQFEIISTGHSNKQSRTISLSFSADWEEKFKKIPYELPDLAVFVKNNLELDNNATIKGNVGTLKSVEQSIYLGNNAKITGNKVEKEKESFPELPEFPVYPDDFPKEPNIVVKKNNKEKYEINYSQLISEIHLSNNSTLTFDVGKSDKEIVVNQLHVGNNGKIHVKGKGKLTIYIKDEMSFDNNSALNDNGELNDLNVFYQGNNRVEFSNNVIINGSLYAKSANIILSNNGGIYGNIFTGGAHVTFENNSLNNSQLILAPNAQVTLSNNSKVKGRVFAKNTILGNNSSIIFDTPLVIDGPISAENLGASDREDSLVETGATPTVKKTPVREVEK